MERMTPQELEVHFRNVEAKRLRQELENDWGSFRMNQVLDYHFVHLHNAEASERLGRTSGMRTMAAFRTHLAFKRLTK
jgi:hypothetical protein